MSATSDAWPIYTPTSQSKPSDAHLSRIARQGVYAVANTAELPNLLARLAAAGQPAPSPTTPVFAHIADTDSLVRNSGAGWVLLAGAAPLVGTYGPGWTDISTNGTYAGVRASKDATGHVLVQGAAIRTGATFTAGVTGTIATLPAEMRPPAGAGFGTVIGVGLGVFATFQAVVRLNVDVLGNLTAQLPSAALAEWSNGGYIAVTGLSFRAAS